MTRPWRAKFCPKIFQKHLEIFGRFLTPKISGPGRDLRTSANFGQKRQKSCKFYMIFGPFLAKNLSRSQNLRFFFWVGFWPIFGHFRLDFPGLGQKNAEGSDSLIGPRKISHFSRFLAHFAHFSSFSSFSSIY